MNINETVLMGRLVHDINLNTTQSNTPVCTFKIAVDREYKGTDGKTVTDFLPVVAWKDRAEFAAKHFRKGQRMIVIGRIQSRDFQDKDGNKKTFIEVEAKKIMFADPKKAGAAANQIQDDAGFFPASDDDVKMPFDV